jgi:hypothetical protein
MTSDTNITLPLSPSSRRVDCMDCRRRARPGRKTCKACGDEREARARGPRATLDLRCPCCWRTTHPARVCPERERS